MTIEDQLMARAGAKCELCGADSNLQSFDVPPDSDGSADKSILACATCIEQIANPEKTDAHHWHCLNEAMWSEVPAVQVMAWRMLNRLKAESWAQNLLDMLYLDDETLAWAEAGYSASDDDGSSIKHRDSNGALLAAGDTVTLIKDLNVKGAGFTAKRGTAVRNISLVGDNEKHIEGRVNGQQIVILTEFVKKS